MIPPLEPVSGKCCLLEQMIAELRAAVKAFVGRMLGL
jgi:hypothetical protein